MTSRSVLDALRHRAATHPSVGIHRTPAVAWGVPRLHRDTREVVVIEDHGGFAFGGNKVRHLDLVLGLARQERADVLLTAAGPQSNLCRVLAAAARHLGLDVHLVQRGTGASRPSGNQILYALTGAAVDHVPIDDPFDASQDAHVDALADGYRRSGRRPFVVDVRHRHAPVSALAQTGLLDEVELPWVPRRIVVAASAGSTAAGLLLSIVARGWDTELLAVSVAGRESDLRRRVLDIAARTATTVGAVVAADDLAVRLSVTDAFVGTGHGLPTPQGTDAAAHAARRSGLFLDGTYTGKAMAALLALEGAERTCFVHTGGGPSVFQDHQNVRSAS